MRIIGRTAYFPNWNLFFDNCLGPEIVSPLHALGLPLRNLHIT